MSVVTPPSRSSSKFTINNFFATIISRRRKTTALSATDIAHPGPTDLDNVDRNHHSFSSSFGINNTLLRRCAVLAAVSTLGHIRPHLGSILLLSRNLCIKYGRLIPLSEASALRFVGEHTSIPVPKVHCAFVHKDITYILMDRIDGHKLAEGWQSRSPESKKKILGQLKRMVDELRSLPPPSARISNVDGGPLHDLRFHGTSSTAGPFESVHDFHYFLRNDIRAYSGPIPEIARMIDLQDRPWPMPVFTHGDLSSLNILVRDDDVVGIIDWETSGWYPPYWERSMAWHVNPWNEFWKEEVGNFLDATPEEMEMERIRLAYFGEFGIS